MLTWFQLGQLGFALVLALAIAERIRAVHFRDATSDDAVRWLVRALEQGATQQARAWARARPATQLARLIEAANGHDGAARAAALRELLVDLREEATSRLRMLRVSATLASTVGLMGGILTIARGGDVKAAGLAALQAGGAERLAMSQAITTMAIGVATSAVVFQALSLLKPAAAKRLLQARQLERVLSTHSD
jgi:hypothetical protein